MDVDKEKVGVWPNIAEPAGSDPKEVMRKYGVIGTMSATDELRKLLDERGVEYEDSELIDHGNRTTTYYTEWGGNDEGDGANVYVEYMDGTVLRMFDATPEQAIAATLRDSEAIEFCKRVEENARERKPLTLFGVCYEPVGDEPFCETVYRWLHDDAPDECRTCEGGMYAALSATLGGGTCEFTQIPEALYDDIECGACGVALWGFQMDKEGEGVLATPNYCPYCGAKVVER